MFLILRDILFSIVGLFVLCLVIGTFTMIKEELAERGEEKGTKTRGPKFVELLLLPPVAAYIGWRVLYGILLGGWFHYVDMGSEQDDLVFLAVLILLGTAIAVSFDTYETLIKIAAAFVFLLVAVIVFDGYQNGIIG